MQGFSEKPDKNGPLERLSRRWEVRIKVDSREIRFGRVAWTDSAEDREKRQAVLNTVVKFRAL